MKQLSDANHCICDGELTPAVLWTGGRVVEDVGVPGSVLETIERARRHNLASHMT